MGGCCHREIEGTSPGSKHTNSVTVTTTNPAEQTTMRGSTTRKARAEAAITVPIKRLKQPLEEKYVLKRELYRSSAGICYLAERRATQFLHLIRKVAITTDRIDIEKEPLQEQILCSETDLLSQIDHPTILQISHVLTERRYMYAVSEAIVGSSVVDYQSVIGNEPAAVEIVTQVLQSLNYCHANSILHKNLSLSNLLILKSTTGDLYVRLLGFGGMRRGPEENLESVFAPIVYAAPEAFSENYSAKSDVWSCGVLLYFLVSKSVPFYAHSKQLFRQFILKPVTFSSPFWSTCNPALIAILRAMLETDPALRPTAEQCLDHAYFHQHSPATFESMEPLYAALRNLKTFEGGHTLKLVVLEFLLANFCDPEEKLALTKVFKSIDTKGDGILTRDELIDAYKLTMPENFAEAAVDHILKTLDLNKNGSIEFSEFLVAASDYQILLETSSLKAAYSLFDTDKSGEITLAEVKSTLKSDASDEQWSELINQVDRNSDGHLDFTEFRRLVRLAVQLASERGTEGE